MRSGILGAIWGHQGPVGGFPGSPALWPPAERAGRVGRPAIY